MSEQTTSAAPVADRFPAHSPEVGQIAAALAKAQGAFPEVKKTKHVKVKTKTGGTYEFDYADLSGILASCKATLAEHGLSVAQLILPNGNGMMLRTMLLHASGEYLSSAMFLSRRENPQELGSEITYMRRYAIASLLGIAADDDDDGNLAAGNTMENRGAGNGQQATRQPPAKAPAVTTIQVPTDKDGAPDWAAFTKAMGAAIDQAPDDAHLNALLKAHNAALSNLKGTDAKAFDALKGQADKRRAFFAQAPNDKQAAE